MKSQKEIMDELNKYNQNHIINIINNFNSDEKQKIYDQLERLDINLIQRLYDSLNKKEKVDIDQVEAMTALNKAKINLSELKEYDSLGKNLIKNGEYALVTMSGGQGTRLGFNKAKGIFEVDTCNGKKSLFQILADKLIDENEKYGVIIPWYIMTSEENNDQIEEYFKENNYFLYPKEYVKFFKQANLPMINEDGKLIIGENKLIKEAANGNGGIFNAMYKNKILEDMKNRGIKWIFISSIDNILLKIADVTLLGLAEKQGVEIATKSILRNSPEEKVGAICKSNNQIRVIEYSEMSDKMKNLKNINDEYAYGESHVMCNLFSLSALNKLANQELPYHIAHKKAKYIEESGKIMEADTPNAYKFETFIFDAWTYFNDIAILRGKREEDFAPIKNKEGIDSPETAIKLYNNYYGGKNI